MLFLLPSFFLFLGNVFSSSITTWQLAGRSYSAWAVSNFNSLVTLGNIYTDENRFNYFGIHNGLRPNNWDFSSREFQYGRWWVGLGRAM